ncbi:twin-arginine translocase TatA/TatE family subunit [Micromonospora sp. NPDC049102]|uniref:twin-arginine translocase TatA/TatE family subunit n=1 Tax=Micromonospora sp. NPDC049102 TaxID=3364265 RepID=UPI003713307A
MRWLLILVIVLLAIGAIWLPRRARSAGRSLRNRLDERRRPHGPAGSRKRVCVVQRREQDRASVDKTSRAFMSELDAMMG